MTVRELVIELLDIDEDEFWCYGVPKAVANRVVQIDDGSRSLLSRVTLRGAEIVSLGFED